MKDEIKEIKINTIGQLLDYVETEEKANKLIDYITNLQEENKRLEEQNKMTDEQIEKVFTIASEQIYKSRNEKAISIINNIFKDENWYENYEYNDLENTLEEVYQTLQGSDKDE